MWYDWTNALLGVALIVVAFLNLSGSTLTWTLGIIGAVIAILGFWGAGVYGSGSRSSLPKMI